MIISIFIIYVFKKFELKESFINHTNKSNVFKISAKKFGVSCTLETRKSYIDKYAKAF